jgi:ketosteroid isomerase-like protein
MSEENVEIVKRAGAAFNESGIEAARRFFAADAVFEEPPEQPAPRVARGIDEIIDLFGKFDEAWAEHKTDIEDVRPVGRDQVLVLSVERFVGRDGIELAAPAGALFTLRDGKIVRWEAFWERERALEAAGISE